jgi:hypothetical protein
VERILPGKEWGGGERVRAGTEGRNDPTYIHVNK